jgi:hypothetical protein
MLVLICMSSCRRLQGSEFLRTGPRSARTSLIAQAAGIRRWEMTLTTVAHFMPMKHTMLRTTEREEEANAQVFVTIGSSQEHG